MELPLADELIYLLPSFHVPEVRSGNLALDNIGWTDRKVRSKRAGKKLATDFLRAVWVSKPYFGMVEILLNHFPCTLGVLWQLGASQNLLNQIRKPSKVPIKNTNYRYSTSDCVKWTIDWDS
jgi:hypothetical protein